MLACSLSHSLVGTVSILGGLSVSISQQPCPSGCVLPTLLQREELWCCAFPLSFSFHFAPGFTPACKINLWLRPFPWQPYLLSQTRRTTKNTPGAAAGSGAIQKDLLVVLPPHVLLVRPLALNSKVLYWNWISVKRKLTPRSAHIIHNTSDYFHDRKGGLWRWGGTSVRLAGANMRRRQTGV